MYLLNASKAHYNSHKASNPRKKKYRFLYLYDDNGKFHRPRVSFFKFYYSKFFKKKAHLATCMFCYEKYATYSKHSIACGLCKK